MIVKFVRNALGLIIVFFDWLSRPRPIKRSEAEQANVQAALQGHSLYQFFACPFCVKTRRAIHRLGVDVELRDINKTPQFRAELESEGGRVKVPCLRIAQGEEVRWMYESNDIIAYLEQRVGQVAG
ncbi:glutaredoxin family protein [Arenicella xantha]|uniref:Glutaredoxin n=1 Tax=Arenicella xantha TaxID=644221 RepID=A0A395JKF8_9GAMM|nr:glutaredoxin [Arenicella xantha]RBP51181.1 glutaredoxin [Arenicella xantha]